MEWIKMAEENDFDQIIVSLKASNTLIMTQAYRLLFSEFKDRGVSYPLHLGVTEAGNGESGRVKSAVGLAALLSEGIGDTIRVSLTGDPVEEIRSAKLILKTLGLRKGGISVVSCPTCGRTRIDLIGLAEKVEKMVSKYDNLDIKVAVMGCVVNGPGEAREADIGIAGGDGCGLVFKKGEILRKVPEDKLIDALLEEVEKL